MATGPAQQLGLVGPDAVPSPRLSEQAELAPAMYIRHDQPPENNPYLPCQPCCPVERASRVSHRQVRDYTLPPPSGRAARTRPPLHRPVRATTWGRLRMKGLSLRSARAACAISLAGSAPVVTRVRVCFGPGPRPWQPRLGAHAQPALAARGLWGWSQPLFTYLCWVSHGLEHLGSLMSSLLTVAHCFLWPTH